MQGAGWVEHDTNMPSGESLVRQYVYGKRFFKEEFGKELDYMFLPDCFGFTGLCPKFLNKQAWNTLSRKSSLGTIQISFRIIALSGKG